VDLTQEILSTWRYRISIHYFTRRNVFSFMENLQRCQKEIQIRRKVNISLDNYYTKLVAKEGEIYS